jgi:O-antigen/teichoic acid export membrane protein
MSKNIYSIVFKNAMALTVGRFFSRIFQFFLFIYAARTLGADYFGIFSFSYILVTMIGLLMDIGITRYSIQQTSRDLTKTQTYLGAILIIKSFLIIFGYILIIGIGFLLGKDSLTMQSLAILTLVAVFDNISLPFSASFEAYQKMHYSAIVILLSNFIMSLVGFIVIFLFEDLILFCLSIVFGALLRCVLYILVFFRKYQKPTFDFDFNFIKKIIKNGIPFLLSSAFISIYWNIDIVMIDYFSNVKDVAYYNAAYRIIDAPLFLIGAVISALFPAFSRLFFEKSEELNVLISKTFNISFAVGLSIAVVISYLSDDIISLLYGSEYFPSSMALQILIFSIAFIMPASICNTAIHAVDKQYLCVFISGSGMFFNIIANLFLIPKYSFIGAAWATLITEISVGLVYMYITKKYITKYCFIEWISIARIFLLSLLLVAFLYITQHFGIFVQILGVSFLFFPFLFITGVLSLKEIKDLSKR